MEMTPISRRKVNIERLSYQPSKPYRYDLEIFRVSNLKRRTRAEAMHWTYSYEFYMLICITQGRCIQLLDFEPVSCSAGTLLVLRPGQAHNFGRDEGWDGWIVLFRPELLLPVASSPHDLRPGSNLDRLPERLSLDSRHLNRATAAIRRMRDDSLLDTFLRSNIPSSENVDRTNELTADVHALPALSVLRIRDLAYGYSRPAADTGAAAFGLHAALQPLSENSSKSTSRSGTKSAITQGTLAAPRGA